MWEGACVVSTAFPDALKGAPGRGAPFALGGGCEEKRRLFLAQPFVAAVRAFAARPVAGDLGVETLRGGLHLLELRDQFRALLFQNLKAGAAVCSPSWNSATYSTSASICTPDSRMQRMNSTQPQSYSVKSRMPLAAG